MSKASEFAKRKPRDLHLPQIGSPFPCSFMVDEEGRLLINNSGPFSPRSVRRLTRWLTATFADPPGGAA